jgi:hypothetical protein
MTASHRDQAVPVTFFSRIHSFAGSASGMDDGPEMYEKQVDVVFYTHNYLWVASQNCLDKAILPHASGADYMLTHAFLGSFLAFEAYVNYIGEIVDPITWKHFSRGRVEKKLEWLCDKLELTIDKKSEPYVTWNDARKNRNHIAHGTVFRKRFKVPFEQHPDTVSYISARWHEILRPDVVKRIRIQLSAFAEMIRSSAHKAAHSTDDDDLTVVALAENGSGRLGSASSMRVRKST